MSHVAGYGMFLLSQREHYSYSSALAIDMTARNMQDQVKKKGLPWSAAKGFDTFTPIRSICLLMKPSHF
jgi:acylpyruvate hydrolase